MNANTEKTYDMSDYILAMKNTSYNAQGRAVITENDEWWDEPEWDIIFDKINKERE